jgi:glycine cleavage system H protein
MIIHTSPVKPGPALESHTVPSLNPIARHLCDRLNLDNVTYAALHEKGRKRARSMNRVTWEEKMEAPPGLKFSKEHEWVAAEGAVATVGLTDHAQEQLGEIVFIELPAVGDKVSKDDPFGVVESVKAVSDIYAPVSGTVTAINEDLPESPEIVNEDPYGDGWLIKVQISDTTDLDDLMDDEEYEEMIAREKED